MSYFDQHHNVQRNVSIYGGVNAFKNPNAELHFAKDFNKKMFNPETLKQKKNVLETGYSNPEHQNVLKENINANQSLKFNSPNYRVENPITYGGKQDKQQTYHCKKTPFSNVDNIRDNAKDMDSTWKSSSKRIDVKPSNNADESKKRAHKKPDCPLFEQNRNPLFGGGERQVASRVTAGGNGNQKISEDYIRMREIKTALPAQRRDMEKERDHTKQFKVSMADKIGTKNTGSECKNLMRYDYAPDYRDQKYTLKENSFKPEERSYGYKENNTNDHRKSKTQFFYYKKN